MLTSLGLRVETGDAIGPGRGGCGVAVRSRLPFLSRWRRWCHTLRAVEPPVLATGLVFLGASGRAS
jgi:hypothetical protein